MQACTRKACLESDRTEMDWKKTNTTLHGTWNVNSLVEILSMIILYTFCFAYGNEIWNEFVSREFITISIDIFSSRLIQLKSVV